MLKTGLSHLRDHLGRVIAQVENKGDRIVIARNGRAVAAIVPMGDYKALEEASRKSLGYMEYQHARHMVSIAALKDGIEAADRAHDGGPRHDGNPSVPRDGLAVP